MKSNLRHVVYNKQKRLFLPTDSITLCTIAVWNIRHWNSSALLA